MGAHKYVDERDGGYYVAGTRIALDSLIIPFQQGASPESIFRSFPLVGSLEKVYGALTFYLAHKPAVEAYLEEQERLARAIGENQAPLPHSLAQKLAHAREESLKS